MSEHKLLLMFLGGVPNSNNIINHWIKINSEFINKNNIYLVIHPIVQTDIQNAVFLSIFKPDNIYIVDSDHHVPTAWATKSLVDATLLMMQYAHKQNENKLFDKYILLSQNCCPLYKLDIIYDELISDNKSICWHINNPEDPIKSQSQWFIFDKRHIEIFFLENKYNETYTKSKKENLCKNKKLNELIIFESDTKESQSLQLFYKTYEPCNPSDEYFFVTYIYKIFKIKSDDMSHFRKISKVNFKNNLNNLPQYIINKLNIAAKTIQNIEQLAPIYSTPGLKNYKKGENTITSLILKDEMNGFSTFVNFIGGTEFNPLNVLRDFKLFELDVRAFIEIKANPIDIKNLILNKISSCNELKKTKIYKELFIQNNEYILSTTVHPIEYSTYSFNNILNTFILLSQIICFFGYNLSYRIEIFAIRNIFLTYLILIVKLFNINNEKININITKLQPEFNTNIATINDFINLFLREKQDKHETYIYYIPHLIEIIDPILCIINRKYSEIDIEVLNNILDKKYGTVINTNILLSALCQESFFIRKCYDTSHIEYFSDILKDCYFITKYHIEDSPIYEEDLFPYDLNKYKNKYLKYKQKYLQLIKNIIPL